MNRATGEERAGPPLHAALLLSVAVSVAPLLSPHPGAAQQPATPGRTGTDLAPSTSPLLPDTVLAPSGQPRIVVLGARGSPVVALRASVPVSETSSEAGAARMLASLGAARARGLSGPVSARIEGRRTPQGVAYTVTGAVHDFDYLAYLLRLALAEPRPGRIDFQRTRNRLIEEARRSSETPRGRIAHRLRDQAFQGRPALDGTVGSLGRLTPETLARVWARTHAPERVTVTVAGDVPLELLLASLRELGAPAAAAARAAVAGEVSTREGAVQVLRRWFGEARVLPDPHDPRGQVAALLVAGHVRDVAGAFEGHVELWEVGDRMALAVIGAAYRRSARAMRSRVQSALTETASALTDAEVAAAVARVRADLLFGARTPWGRAEMVGRHMDRRGDRRAALDHLAALDRLDTESMRSYLRGLAEQTPVRAEVTP